MTGVRRPDPAGRPGRVAVWARRAVVAVVAALLGVLILPGRAQAHPTLLLTTPAADTAIPAGPASSFTVAPPAFDFTTTGYVNVSPARTAAGGRDDTSRYSSPDFSSAASASNLCSTTRSLPAGSTAIAFASGTKYTRRHGPKSSRSHPSNDSPWSAPANFATGCFTPRRYAVNPPPFPPCSPACGWPPSSP